MDGWPVWLASASLRRRSGRILPAKDWDEETTARVSAGLDVALDGVGDPEHEREFRMCITLCRHRAVTEEEFARLPAWWHEADAIDIAGGPVEVRWFRGVRETPGTQPCVAPGKRSVGDGLWLPEDCGECEPCRARATVRAMAGKDVRPPWK